MWSIAALKKGNENCNFVFVTGSCCLLVPLLLTKPCWTVTVIKEVQTNIHLSLIVLHTRVCVRVDITWALPEPAAPPTQGPSSGARSRNTDVWVLNTLRQTRRTQWRDRGQEVSLDPAHVSLTETGRLDSAVTLGRLSCPYPPSSPGSQRCHQSSLHPPAQSILMGIT